MTERERYIAALRFERPDRVPFDPGKGRESTLAAWHTQGLPPEITDRPLTLTPRRDVTDDAERERTLDALRRTGGKREEAARLLGISRATLYRRMKALQAS